MQREKIESTVASLPQSELGVLPNDDEIWEEQDGEANIKVTRHVLPTPNHISIVSLTVSGPSDERLRVIKEFIEVYGQPAVPISLEPHMDTVVWRYAPTN